MFFMKTVHEALQVIREHLSQSEVSRRTGISQSKLSRWEAGDVASGADDALKLVALARELSSPDIPAPAEKAEAGHG